MPPPQQDEPPSPSPLHPPLLHSLLDLLGAHLPRDLHQQLAEQSTEALVAGLVVLAVALLLLVWAAAPRRSRLGGGGRGSKPVVLAGPCGGGKTCLFFQLRDGSTHSGTVASMQENEGLVRVAAAARGGGGQRSVRVLDVPGHERLRQRLEQHLADAAAVVFVIDATDTTPHKVRACSMHAHPCTRITYACKGTHACVQCAIHPACMQCTPVQSCMQSRLHACMYARMHRLGGRAHPMHAHGSTGGGSGGAV